MMKYELSWVRTGAKTLQRQVGLVFSNKIGAEHSYASSSFFGPALVSTLHSQAHRTDDTTTLLLHAAGSP